VGSIISSGVGSGLDVAGLVQKLVEAEGAPKTLNLNKQEAKAQAKISAFGTLRSALASFRDTLTTLKNVDKFQGRQVTLSTPDFIKGSATSAALPGTYSIHVEQLASAHKLRSGPHAAADIIGTGTLSIQVGAETLDIVVDGTNNTLSGISAAINASAAGEHLQATVITGVDGAVLTLSARNTGADNAIVLSATGDAGLTAFAADFELTQAAADARAFIDDIEVTSATNTLTGAIDGVDIQLVAANEPDKTTQLTVGYDRAGARKTIDDLVKGYNAVVDAIASVASYNATTQTGGPLFGDAGVRNIVYQLRRELTSAVAGLDGSFDTLNEIGITAQVSGKLSVDTAKLDAAFASDFDGIGELFAADGKGIAVKLETLLTPYLETGGVLDSRTAGLKVSIEDIGDQREALTRRLESLQARYLRQFNALDGLLAQMSSTSSFLTQQLSRLSDITASKS
jgi:flagellar hook-associated protein 2